MDQLLEALPEELLFTVSTYGQVPPGLTPEYILREVNRISYKPVEWAKEFTLEYLRATDRLYRNIGHVLRVIPVGVISGVALYEGVPLVVALDIVVSSDSEFDSIATSVLSVDPDVRTRRLRRDPTGRPRYSLLVPMRELPDTSDDDDSEIRNMIYLAYPRTYLSTPRAEGNYSMTKVGRPGDVRKNYPWLMSTMDKLGLSRAFPRWFPQPPRVHRSSVYIPSDIEIIRAILRINPRYNLGDLLNWLRVRMEVCPSVQESYPEMYRLVTQGLLRNITVWRHATRLELSLVATRARYRDELSRYLESMGLSPDAGTGWVMTMVTITMPTDNVEGTSVLESIINSYMTVRMCLLSYSPKYIVGKTIE